MTAIQLRTSSALGAILALGLGACTFEPRYPIHEGQAPGQGVVMDRPAYPIRQAEEAPAAAPAPPVAPPHAAPPPAEDQDAPHAAPSAPVESSDLPPPGASPQTSAPPHGGAETSRDPLLQSIAYDGPRLIPESLAEAAEAGADGAPAGLTEIALRGRHSHSKHKSSAEGGSHHHHGRRAHEQASEDDSGSHGRHHRHRRHEEASEEGSSRHGRHHHRRSESASEEGSGRHRHGRRGRHEETRLASSRHASEAEAQDETSEAVDTPYQITVRRGETLAEAAKRAHVSKQALAELNGLTTRSHLKTGETLKVPYGYSYKVAKGDTVEAIADRFDENARTLERLNHLSRHASLHRGERLKLPLTAEDTGEGRHARGDTSVEAAPARLARESLSRAERRHETEQADNASQAPRLRMASANRNWSPNFAPLPAPAQPSYRAAPGVVAGAPTYRAGPGVIAAASAAPGATAASVMASRWNSNAYGSSGSTASAPGQLAYNSKTPPAGYAPPTPSEAAAAEAVGTPPSASELAAGRAKFVWPLKGDIISPFGQASGGAHNDGVDIACQTGESVRAAAGGEVVYAGNLIPGMGNLVMIKHPGGWITAYGHLSRIEVHMKDNVAQGQEVGLAGQTGAASRPELHFEVRYTADPLQKPRPVDPASVLPSG